MEIPHKRLGCKGYKIMCPVFVNTLLYEIVDKLSYMKIGLYNSKIKKGSSLANNEYMKGLFT